MAKKKKKKKAKKKEFPVAAPAKIAEKSGAGNQDERILNILGVDDEDDAEVSDENLKKYFEFLKEILNCRALLSASENRAASDGRNITLSDREMRRNMRN